jgi:hypothetical protein
MPGLLARLGGYTPTPAPRPTREEIADRLAERLGLAVTPYDQELLETRTRFAADHLRPAAQLGGAFCTPYPRYIGADGADVDTFSAYGGVPVEAWFPITIDDDTVGYAIVSGILGPDPKVRVELGRQALPTVSLLDEPALFELVAELATTLRGAIR